MSLPSTITQCPKIHNVSSNTQPLSLYHSIACVSHRHLHTEVPHVSLSHLPDCSLPMSELHGTILLTTSIYSRSNCVLLFQDFI